MRTAVLLLNLIASLASAAWAVVALFRPASLSESIHITDGEEFYVRMYAARAIPFGLIVGVLPLRAEGIAVTWILVAAAVVQIADIIIAVHRKNIRMIGGATVGAIAHLACALVI